jgi:tight adherence protein B
MTGVALLTILVFALIGQAIWLLFDALRGDAEAAASSGVSRVQEYTTMTWETGAPDALSILKRKRYSRFQWLDGVLRRLDLADSLSRDLVRAGVPMRAGEFLLLQLAATTLVGFAAFLLVPFLLGGLLPAAVGAAVGFMAPLLWLRVKRAGRLSQFEHDLPDALDLIAGGLRAGYGLVHGFDLVAHESDGPCAEELGQVLQEVQLGGELEAALARVEERIDSEDVRLLATAVGVQRRTGGNLIDVLSQMARVLRERQRLRREVRVITTAPRVSGYVVSCLPILVAIAMYFLSRYYIETLFTEPIGQLAMVAGSVLVGVGLFLNKRISSVEM